MLLILRHLCRLPLNTPNRLSLCEMLTRAGVVVIVDA
jgi:hypothetical protein